MFHVSVTLGSWDADVYVCTCIVTLRTWVKTQLCICCWTQVCVSNTQWGQTIQNIGVWSTESFTAEPSKKNRWLILRRPELPNGFQFKGKTWGEGCMVYDFLWLVGGKVTRCSRNLNHQPSGSDQSGSQHVVTALHLDGGLSSCRTQRYVSGCYVYPLQEEVGLCFIIELLFLDCFSFVTVFPHFPN